MKRLFVFSFFSFFLISAHGQIQFGAKGGLNLAWTPSTAAGVIVKNMVAFNAGLFAVYPVSRHLDLQLELVYSVQGAAVIFHDAYSPDLKATSKYNYLNIPLLLAYKHRSGLFIETGLQLGTFLGGNTVYGDTVKVNDKNNVQRSDIAWIVGLGYRIPKINLGLDVRYNISFTNYGAYASAADNPVYYRVLQIDLFYIFKKF